ncbi:uncharacterized protein A4U43_C04F23840 [Asparagus officinalis]|uniref:Expansin-like EG45 domain-containing protein n=1 Tax=Asparagus officinalis TaxID=4686 RepID=A0A5P1F3W9_ASPOF|nr:uncharacterized protein A4U43_C04F23840 [Asparagus officinalis]
MPAQGSPGFESGSCGYGSLALGFNKGFVASASSSIYRDGIGCGGCYQIRCKDPRLCSTKGVTVIVTDQKPNNRTDFVLNAPAFTAMAKAGSAQSLKESGLVAIEYRRVPCNYKNKNLAIRLSTSPASFSNLAYNGSGRTVRLDTSQLRADAAV